MAGIHKKKTFWETSSGAGGSLGGGMGQWGEQVSTHSRLSPGVEIWIRELRRSLLSRKWKSTKTLELCRVVCRVVEFCPVFQSWQEERKNDKKRFDNVLFFAFRIKTKCWVTPVVATNYSWLPKGNYSWEGSHSRKNQPSPLRNFSSLGRSLIPDLPDPAETTAARLQLQHTALASPLFTLAWRAMEDVNLFVFDTHCWHSRPP